MKSSNASRAVGARELKIRLGRYLGLVRAGATITVTERGRPVARLSPVRASDNGVDAILDELDALGIVSKASGKPLLERKPTRVTGEHIGRTLSRVRDDRL